MAELVTIATFDNLVSAHVLRARLQAANITCFLTDENIFSIMPLASLGGIKVQVYVEDSLRAFDIYFETQDNSDNLAL